MVCTKAFSKRRAIGCFAAGTLVHTKEGLKPIQDIRVGDDVLSKPESGNGENAYKRVVDTFCFENKPVWYVEYLITDPIDKEVEHRGADYLVVTPNHLFWVIGGLDYSVGGYRDYAIPRWKAVDQLAYEDRIVLSNGQLAKVCGVAPICQTRNSDIGWHQANYADSSWEENGHAVQFSEIGTKAQVTFLEEPTFFDDVPRDELDDYLNYQTVVYNLEIEDFHTYFVGKMGVWVHDSSSMNTSITQ